MFKLSALQKQTRNRGKNFAPSEEIKLLELLEPYRHIIDNKNSDSATCQLKKETWEKLAHQFSSQTGSNRTWRTLKDKYKNMNSKLKTAGSMIPRYPHSEEFDPVSSCVSVVYEDSDPENSLHNDQADSIESPTFKTETNNEFQETPEDTPTEPEHQFVKKKLPRRFIISKRSKKRLLDDEQIALIRLQQRFYYNENIRSAEKHRLELRSINLKNELMELELEEKRRRLRIDD
ncbi:myb/SANT-like DNA-binding domain-containing protein 3 isoform X2 [Drosophila suzukii]|uniref:Regulatory protein zeste n=1 Tax=Drosophila suzukii TaxID=28584 RepID=A0ABM4TL18_DROSZ